MLALGDRERPLRLLGADLDKLLTGGEVLPAPRAPVKRRRVRLWVADKKDGAGRSPPQRPTRYRMLAPGPAPVMVRAGAAPIRRVNDVQGGRDDSGEIVR